MQALGGEGLVQGDLDPRRRVLRVEGRTAVPPVQDEGGRDHAGFGAGLDPAGKAKRVRQTVQGGLDPVSWLLGIAGEAR